MVYNDTDNKTGICQEIDTICGSNTTSYPLVDKNRRLNGALDEFVLIVLQESSGWSAEDSAETDLSIATRNLTSGQSDYSFPSELLVLEKLEVLSSDGSTWIELTPTDQIDPNAGTGIPTEYKKLGNSFILSKSPNYTVSSGIRAYYRRAFNYSTVSSTSFSPTSPGIPSVFHMWLARKAALPYLIENQIPSKNDIAALIEVGNRNIVSYYAVRPMDIQKRLTAAFHSTR